MCAHDLLNVSADLCTDLCLLQPGAARHISCSPCPLARGNPLRQRDLWAAVGETAA